MLEQSHEDGDLHAKVTSATLQGGNEGGVTPGGLGNETANSCTQIT